MRYSRQQQLVGVQCVPSTTRLLFVTSAYHVAMVLGNRVLFHEVIVSRTETPGHKGGGVVIIIFELSNSKTRPPLHVSAKTYARSRIWSSINIHCELRIRIMTYSLPNSSPKNFTWLPSAEQKSRHFCRGQFQNDDAKVRIMGKCHVSTKGLCVNISLNKQ